MFNEDELHVLLMFLRLAATAAVAVAPFALLVFAIKVAAGARGVVSPPARSPRSAAAAGDMRKASSQLRLMQIRRNTHLASSGVRPHTRSKPLREVTSFQHSPGRSANIQVKSCA